MGTAPTRRLPGLDSKLLEAELPSAAAAAAAMAPPPPQRHRGSMRVIPEGRVRRSIETIAAETIAAEEEAARARAAPTATLVGGGGAGSGEEAIARRLFDQFDSDKSGAIDADELHQLCRVLGDPLGPDSHGILMRRLDTDRDGQIRFEEFVSFWDAMEECGRTPGVVAAVAVEAAAAAEATPATPQPKWKANIESARTQQEAQQRSAQSLERAAAARERAAQARERAAAQVEAAVQVRERAAEMRQRSAARGQSTPQHAAKAVADYALSSASRQRSSQAAHDAAHAADLAALRSATRAAADAAARRGESEYDLV